MSAKQKERLEENAAQLEWVGKLWQRGRREGRMRVIGIRMQDKNGKTVDEVEWDIPGISVFADDPELENEYEWSTEAATNFSGLICPEGAVRELIRYVMDGRGKLMLIAFEPGNNAASTYFVHGFLPDVSRQIVFLDANPNRL